MKNPFYRSPLWIGVGIFIPNSELFLAAVSITNRLAFLLDLHYSCLIISRIYIESLRDFRFVVDLTDGHKGY